MKQKKSLSPKIADILKEYIEKIRKEIPLLQNSKDVEPLHRMRVYSRRLRAAFAFVREVFPRKKLKKIKKRIRLLGKTLGEARQLDVQIMFIQILLKKKTNNLLRYGLRVILKTLQLRRNAVSKKIESLLKTFEKKRLFHRLSRYIQIIQEYQKEYLERSLQKRTRRIVFKKLKAMLKISYSLKDTYNAELLHALRISAKQLRYSLEILEALYGKKFTPYMKEAKRLQDVLGDLHEYDVWLAQIPHLKKTHKEDARYTAGIKHIQQICRQQRIKKYRQFTRLWRRQQEQKIWKRLEETL
ncbi:MAG: CHAD domain-containing protein [Candidatus Omnitrophica bacterium]|nr:CHAD domain-containing protein [Candidatus Omnitrophota bacterium]